MFLIRKMIICFLRSVAVGGVVVLVRWASYSLISLSMFLRKEGLITQEAEGRVQVACWFYPVAVE